MFSPLAKEVFVFISQKISGLHSTYRPGTKYSNKYSRTSMVGFSRMQVLEPTN